MTSRKLIGDREALQRIGLAIAMVSMVKFGETISHGSLSVMAEIEAGRTMVTLTAWFNGQLVACFRVPTDGRPYECTSIRSEGISRWLPTLLRKAKHIRYVAAPTIPTHQLSPTVH